ncbi:hypothetical protein P3T76_009736 [Phytophthora citrophthora]|uniref:Uncharacterized protein n=1 Tax=Phytophthora citrophthora TaxID=4793 RepID=A0AAD9GEP3_9STRA|nr:hypothetical protein P3T76_009736 [Phytophthora citrophthora]
MEDDLVLDQLKQRAEAAVPQLPSVFAANGVQSPNGDDECELDKDIWSHVQTGDFQSTLICVRLVPFAMHSTSAVIWETLSYPNKSFASQESSNHDVTPVAHVLERLPNACAMKFRGEIQRESGDSMNLDYYAVVHRTELGVPYNANVFVWHSFSKLAGGDIEYSDTMWGAVTRCPSGGLESIVTVVNQSQLGKVGRSGDASGVLAALMPATGVCIESILSSADTLLLEGNFSHNSGETLVQTGDV